jgi:hypothetical protein
MLSWLLLANGCWSTHVPALPPVQVEPSLGNAGDPSALQDRTGAVVLPLPFQEQLGLQQSQ